MSTHTTHHAQVLNRPVYADSSEALASLEALSAQLFRRRDWRRRGAQYLQALLTAPTVRCNAERLAGVVGVSPRAFQRFLSEALWDHNRVRDSLQALIEPYLNSSDGIWVLEEIGFTKQGNKSVGVGRQYNPTLGKRDNCQIGVFLRYASARGQAVVDTRLYLPQSWINDRPRCQAAGVPDTIVYQSHGDLALDMLRAATARGHLHGRWVTGSHTFGRNTTFRNALDAGGWWYMLEVSLSMGVVAASVASGESRWTSGDPMAARADARPNVPRVQMISTLAARLPTTAWHRGMGAGESHPSPTYLYAAIRVREYHIDTLGMECWLVLQRSLDGAELLAYRSNAPDDHLSELLEQVRALNNARRITLLDQHNAIGLMGYETRSWQGWHRHIALCLLAGTFLMQLQQGSGEKDAFGVLGAATM